MAGSNNILIAVGGGGQDVALAYLRWLALSGGVDPQLNREVAPPQIFVFDADSGAGADSPNRLTQLNTLALTLGAGPIEHVLPYKGKLTADQTFAEYMGARPGDKLLSAFFSEADGATKLHEGMFARPHVGAATIFSKLEEMKDAWGRETRSMNKEGGDAVTRLGTAIRRSGARIAVVGSSFGGTGSGGVPALAQVLAGEFNASVHAFLTLSWFDIGDILRNEKFACNTVGGLRFYSMQPRFKDKIAWTVASYPWLTDREKQDDARQTEEPHVFNLVLAAAVRRFFSGHNDDPGGRTFSLPENAQSLDAASSELLLFDVAREDRAVAKEELQDLVQITQAFRFALDALAFHVEKGFEFRGDLKPMTENISQDSHPVIKLLAQVQGKDTSVKPPPTGLLGGRGLLGLLGLGKKEDAYKINKAVRDAFAEALRDIGVNAKETLRWLQEAKSRSGAQRLELDEALFADHPFEVYARIPVLNVIAEKEGVSGQMTPDQREGVGWYFFAGAVLNKDFVGEFDKRCKSGGLTYYELAARLVANRLWVAVLENHQKIVGTTRKSEVANLTSGFLPINVASRHGRQPNATEFPFDITVLLKGAPSLDIRAGHGDILEPANARHPASFRKLRAHGVPSPWSAAHVETWRLHPANDNSEDNVEDMEFIGSGRNPAMSLPGRARRRLEAVLWGLFTGKLRIEELPLGKDGLGAILHQALAAEMDQQALSDHSVGALKVLRVAVRTDNGALVAANHPACAWFPIPAPGSKDTEKGIEPDWWADRNLEWDLIDDDARKLPSEFDYSKNQKESQRIREGRAVYDVRFSSEFRARKAKAFYLWLNELLATDAPFTPVTGGDAVYAKAAKDLDEGQAVWRRVLERISADIRAKPEVGAAKYDPANLVPVAHSTMILEEVSQDEGHRYLRQIGLSVWPQEHGKKEKDLKALMKQIFVVELAVPEGSPLWRKLEDQATEADAVGEDFPMPISGLAVTAAERPHLVGACCKLVGHEPGVSHWEVEWGDYTIAAKVPYKKLSTSLSTLLWPKFSAPEWGIYVVGSQADDSLRYQFYGKSGQVISTYQKGASIGQAASIGPLDTTRSHELTSRPEFMELVETKGTGVGLYRIPSAAVKNDGGAACDLSLDFGTTHSCVFAEITKAGEKFVIPVRLGSDDPLECSELLFPVSPNDKKSWILPFILAPRFIPSVVGSQSSSLLPSELRWLNEEAGDKTEPDCLSESLKSATGVGWFPAMPTKFRIPGFTPSWFRNVESEFKWPIDDDGRLRGRHDHLRDVYLRQYLTMVFAELVGQHGISTIDLVATYPLAFPQDRRDHYEEALRTIATETTQLAGIALNEFVTLDESLAALYACKPHGVQKGCYIVLDMGGGTTDVAAFQILDGKYQRVLVDSLRYAGHDVVDLMVRDDAFADQFLRDGDMGKGLDRGDLTEALRNAIRNPDYLQKVKDIIRVCGPLRDRLQGFFEGLFFYISRLASALREKHCEGGGSKDGFVLDIQLLGNGWGLARLAYDKSITDIIKEKVATYFSASSAVCPSSTTKCGFARNASHVSSLGEKISDKNLTAYGAIRANESQADHKAIKLLVAQGLFLSGFRMNYAGKDYSADGLVEAKEVNGGDIDLKLINLPEDFHLPKPIEDRLAAYCRGDWDDLVAQPLRNSLRLRGDSKSSAPLGLLSTFLIKVWKVALRSWS